MKRSSTSSRDGAVSLGAEQRAIDLGEEIGIGIGGAAEHHAVDMGEMRRRASASDPMPPLMTISSSGRRAFKR